MRTIWKFEIPNLSGLNEIAIPVGGTILHFALQHGTPCIWVLVDVEPKQSNEIRKFIIIGTGHKIPEDIQLQYVDTIQMVNGFLVWHLFEVKEE